MTRPILSSILSTGLRVLDRVAPPAKVQAHCDIPCGIYDPHLLQIAALTVIRMNQLIEGLQGDDQATRHSFTRYTLVKEEHAELAKRALTARSRARAGRKSVISALEIDAGQAGRGRRA